jgi:protein TonB
MHKSGSQNSPSTDNASATDDLRLLVAWPNPLAIFAGNLADRLLGRVVPELLTTSAPDHRFWRDIDLRTPLPRRGLFDSAFAHAALLGLLYAVSIWPESTAHLADPLSRPTLNGYTLSEYLPELHGARTHSRPSGIHDPVLARQEITSLPENPDNLRQTIITPPKLKIGRDIALPNIVAYQPAAPVQPLAASLRDSARLRLPGFIPEVIGPAADTSSLRSHSQLPAFEPRIVEPAPDVSQTNPRLALPAFQPRVVEPAPDLGYVSRGAKVAKLAGLAPIVAEPVPEAPSVADAQHTYKQIIALNLHPAEVHAPVELPSGNRQGAFSLSPNGRPEATGTPGTGASPNTGLDESKTPVNAPAGITVAAAPPATAANVSASNASPHDASPSNASPHDAAPADPRLRAKFMAAMRPPMSIPPHQPVAHEAASTRSELENRIFAGRRSYTLSVNMPNLNAATGSWIIHFVERDPGSAQSPIAAPEVVSKSDPAYPGELMHDGVQGTVVLTAIIRADGSVGNIAVAKSLDPRLDRNAVQALEQWLFRPALKDGRAIDLEAVITVPFRANTARF